MGGTAEGCADELRPARHPSALPRFDTALAASLARYGIDLPPDTQITARPRIRSTLDCLRADPLRDLFLAADDAQRFTQKIAAVPSPVDLQRWRHGKEDVLQDIIPSRLVQLRLAHAYFQQSDIAASTGSFLALRDRRADTEVDDLRQRST